MTERYDKKGIPVRPADLLKVWHFRAAHRRRKVYMYFLVETDPDNDEMVAVSLRDAAWPTRSRKHRVLIKHLENFEVIDGACRMSANGELECWWERPRRKKEATCTPTKH